MSRIGEVLLHTRSASSPERRVREDKPLEHPAAKERGEPPNLSSSRVAHMSDESAVLSTMPKPVRHERTFRRPSECGASRRLRPFQHRRSRPYPPISLLCSAAMSCFLALRKCIAVPRLTRSVVNRAALKPAPSPKGISLRYYCIPVSPNLRMLWALQQRLIHLPPF